MVQNVVGKTILVSSVAIVTVLATVGPVSARQEDERDFRRSRPRRETEPSHAALKLTVGDVGLTFGNSRDANGIRFNFRDRDLGTVNGINFTVWRYPSRGERRNQFPNPDGIVNGLAVGVYGPQVARINGMAVGLAAVEVEDDLWGVGVSGLATVAGNIHGFALGGLAIVAAKDFGGIGVGGLATVTGRDAEGLLVGGLAVVGGGEL